MTIRQLIQKRAKRAALVACGSMVALLACSVLLDGTSYGWLGIPFMFTFMGAAIYATWIIDCPKCHVQLGQAVWNIASPKLSVAAYRFCPHCAVALDSDAPGL